VFHFVGLFFIEAGKHGKRATPLDHRQHGARDEDARRQYAPQSVSGAFLIRGVNQQ
jgi:hypothetical protein